MMEIRKTNYVSQLSCLTKRFSFELPSSLSTYDVTLFGQENLRAIHTAMSGCQQILLASAPPNFPAKQIISIPTNATNNLRRLTMEGLLAILVLVVLVVSSVPAYPDEDITGKMQEAREFHEKEQARVNHEATRDKSHDGRVSIGKDTSVGGAGDKDHKTDEMRGEVNVKKAF